MSFEEKGFHLILPADSEHATQRPGTGPSPKHLGQEFFYLAIVFWLITENYPDIEIYNAIIRMFG